MDLYHSSVRAALTAVGGCEGEGLYQFIKLINAEACLSNDGAERTAVQFFMIGHDQLGERNVTP